MTAATPEQYRALAKTLDGCAAADRNAVRAALLRESAAALRTAADQLRVVRALAERTDLDVGTLRGFMIEAVDHPGFVPRLPDVGHLTAEPSPPECLRGLAEVQDDAEIAAVLRQTADLLERTEAARRTLIRDNNDSDDAGIRWFTEAHRLRAVIENAPHDRDCDSLEESSLGDVWESGRPCTFWKADALS